MPKSVTEKIVECRSPKGRSVRMERWYYEAIRTALLQILPEPGVCAELFDLHNRVAEHLDVVTRKNIESLVWHVAWVRLDLDHEGVLSRDAALVVRL